MKRFATRTVEVALDEEGIVAARIQPGQVQTVEDARANLAAAFAACGGLRRPLLLDLRHAVEQPAEVRHVYSGPVMNEFFTAIALLVRARPLERIIASIYLRVTKPNLPTRLCVDEDAARIWLRQATS